MPRRVDENQKEIVKEFRKEGASVQILSDVGMGCPDIVVGFDYENYLVEIKNGTKPPSGQKLTEHEQIFHDNWKGQVCVIKSKDEVVDFMEKMKQKGWKIAKW